MSLTIPVGPDDHAEGPADAPVTLVEYGDYQCPHCLRAFPIVKALQREFGTKLRFVFRNMPLQTVHEFAVLAAEAAEAAGLQGQFWHMHDRLYEHQDRLGPALVLDLARRLHLDLVRFEHDLTDPAVTSRVQHDFSSGIRSGVNGTPTFFVNGVRHDLSWDEGTLSDVIRHQINVAARSGSRHH